MLLTLVPPLQLVFIGKNLNHSELKSDFVACAATPEVYAKKLKMLRFKVGQKVKCSTGDGWQAGEIVKLMFRDEYMEPGMIAPYQVKLGDGTLIYAPADVDEVIKSA